MPDNKPAPVPASSFPWSENTRGIVSVLLVAHLAGLGLIFWGNNDFDPGRNAVVLDRAKKVLNPYLFALWFDRKWDQRIANGDEVDGDHALRFVVKGPDGKPIEVARFPAEKDNLPEERERWQQFANDIAHAKEREDDTTGFDNRMMLLAKSWLAQQRAAGKPYDVITVEVRRRMRVSLEGNPQADPYAPQYYPPPPYGDESRKILQPVEIHWPRGEGEPFLIELGGTKRDQAPVVPSNSQPSTSPKPQPMATPQPMPPAQPQPETPPLPAPQPMTPPSIDVTPAGK